MSVPEGTYDIMFYFIEKNPGDIEETMNKYVIREQVTIDHDMQMLFAASEAKNYIRFQALTIDGEPVYTGKQHMDDQYNLSLIEEGNVDDVLYNTIVHCEGYGDVMVSFGNYGLETDGKMSWPCHEENANIYVNDVSSRFSFYGFRVIEKDNNIYTWAHEVKGVSESITLTNDISNYVPYEIELPVVEEGMIPSLAFYAVKENDASPFPMRYYLKESIIDGDVCSFNCYLGAAVEDSGIYAPFIMPDLGRLEEDMMFGSYVRPIVRCLPITLKDNNPFFANNGSATAWIGEYDYVLTDFLNIYMPSEDGEPRFVEQSSFWPAHPNFSFTRNQKKGELFNNCPMLQSSCSIQEGYGEYGPYKGLSVAIDYIGRYGEKNSQDWENNQVTIKLDDEDIASFQGGSTVIIADEYEMLYGVIDVNIANENAMVDNLAGSNKTHLHFTSDAQNLQPPTLTMLQFKDNNGDVTDRMSTAEEGIVEFSAANLIMPNGVNQPYYRYNISPEIVKVSYSPYGEDNWNELIVEEVPETYYPIMGWFYRGSLAAVTGEAYEGWFDLKIRLEDAAGNWQEQVISPAFRIDDLAYSSVATVGKDNAREVARYNLAGQRIDGDAKGVVIVKMSDGTARKILVP